MKSKSKVINILDFKMKREDKEPIIYQKCKKCNIFYSVKKPSWAIDKTVYDVCPVCKKI